MTGPKVIFFCVALVIFGLFMVVQRQIVSATAASFQSQAGQQEQGQRTLFTVAAAQVLDPDFFDKPAFHSPITMAVVAADPSQTGLDDIGKIRAAFDLSQRLDHNAILERYLQDIDFGLGCRGFGPAMTGLSVGTNTSPTFETVALATMLKNTRVLASDAAALQRDTVELAETLRNSGQISEQILSEIQTASASEFAVTGSCTS